MEFGDADYPDEISDGLMILFSNAGCREIPNCSNLERLIIQSARYTFLVKPAGALIIMNNGIPKEHLSFWKHISIEKLKGLYVRRIFGFT